MTFKINALLTGLTISLITLHVQAACKVVSYPKIIKLNKLLDESIIKSSNCSEHIKNKFIDFISGASGELSSRHLSQIFKLEYKSDIELSPSKIEVKPITDVLTVLVDIPKNIVLDKMSNLHSESSLNLHPEDHLQAVCNNCETSGHKNIKLLVNKSPIWLSVEFLSKRHGLIINREINPFAQNLSQQMFTYTAIFDDGREHLFNDVKNIQFYKPNKKLIKGKILKSTDLSPIVLVKPGQKIKILLKGENMALKSSAIARQPGRFGDYIEVYNQKTNKKINAQVIDFNTVMVEL